VPHLAPILLKNRDLIFALEAGFIGSWGEWHHSTTGNNNATTHKQVLDKELSYFKGVFPILLRWPGDLITYGGMAASPDLGIHDDYYASHPTDGGTWDSCNPNGDPGGYGWCLSNTTAAQMMAYAEQVSTSSVFVGEFGALYPTLQNCAALDSYSYRFHVQSISLNIFPSEVGTFLQNNGCATSFLNKVGTRIELQRLTLIGNPTAGGTLFVAVTLLNTGYGRVVRARPATLVLVSNGSVVAQLPISLQDLDLRQLVSSATPTPRTFQFNVTLPPNLPSGQLSAALLIPDPAPSLTFQPQYALPLNSVDQNQKSIFDSTTGYNTLGSFVAGSGNQIRSSPVVLSQLSAAPTDLTGSWAGDGPVELPQGISMLTLADASARWAVRGFRGGRGTPRIDWTLSQSGTHVNGTVAVTLQGSPMLTGILVGTSVNRILTYTVDVPAGAVPIAPDCSGHIEGVVNVTSTSLVGSASPRGTGCFATHDDQFHAQQAVKEFVRVVSVSCYQPVTTGRNINAKIR
jgi:hypothetical protein